MAGDAAYPLSSTCITPFKRNNRMVSIANRKRFNKRFSKTRVRVENCIGEIKKQFPSFHEIRMRINYSEDIDYCSNWLVICCMLHNFIMDYPDYDGFITDEDLIEEEVLMEDDDESIAVPVDGDQRRMMLFLDLFGSID